MRLHQPQPKQHLQRLLLSKLSTRWLILGLGNPGSEYAATRHNIGFQVVEELARRNSAAFASHKSRAEVAQYKLGFGGDAPTLILGKSKSFMNESGGPAKSLTDFFKVDIENLVVIHDELDLPFEAIRVKAGGGDNGHNGLKSISKVLTPQYLRVRMGIGRPIGQQDPADFVLKAFASSEKAALPTFIARGADCVETLVSKGLTGAQQEFNS